MSDRDDGSDITTDRAPDEGKGQVVRLQDYETCRPDRVLREMRSYWDSIRNGRAVPARSDVDPRGISRTLDYAFILERIAPGAGRIRLAGRHLIDLMGMEVRGMPICAFLATSSRGRFSDVLESVFKAPQIAQLNLYARPEYARPELTGQMLLLPLRSDLGDVTRALGCLVAEGDPGIAPRRFELTADEVMPIIAGGKTLEPSPSTIGFAEAPSPFARGQRARTPPTTTRPEQPRAETPEERRTLFRVIQAAPLDDSDKT
ncbi:MAG: PAS domain-containing protein [Alphaproteobacteria bacterium]|nr:PAS domain-containing protein [Alphaproteobacteria bacterium]